jgi:uncharacterized membrane protein YphA (DoxX/SURF4 family)
MKTLNTFLEKFEISSSLWMKKNGLVLLRLSIGIIFFWFGILKFFPGLSPAQDIAIRTINILTFGLMPATVSIITLAAWEVLIGLGFITGKFLRLTLLLLFAQMAGTFMPVFILPNEVFTAIPYAPTLEGQYIIKNIVVVSAGIVLGANILKNKRE